MFIIKIFSYLQISFLQHILITHNYNYWLSINFNVNWNKKRAKLVNSITSNVTQNQRPGKNRVQHCKVYEKACLKWFLEHQSNIRLFLFSKGERNQDGNICIRCDLFELSGKWRENDMFFLDFWAKSERCGPYSKISV